MSMEWNGDNARFLGAAFLFVVATTASSNLLLTGMTNAETISLVMKSVSKAPLRMLASILGDLISAAGIVLLAVLLYATLEKQGPVFARWALGLWVLEAAFLALTKLLGFSLLCISREFVKAGSPEGSFFQAVGSMVHGSMDYAYLIHLLFYLLGGILFYSLLLKSNHVPKAIPLFGIIAVCVGIAGLIPALFGNKDYMIALLPILPFELTIGGWLVAKGFSA